MKLVDRHSECAIDACIETPRNSFDPLALHEDEKLLRSALEIDHPNHAATLNVVLNIRDARETKVPRVKNYGGVHVMCRETKMSETVRHQSTRLFADSFCSRVKSMALLIWA